MKLFVLKMSNKFSIKKFRKLIFKLVIGFYLRLSSLGNRPLLDLTRDSLYNRNRPYTISCIQHKVAFYQALQTNLIIKTKQQTDYTQKTLITTPQFQWGILTHPKNASAKN